MLKQRLMTAAILIPIVLALLFYLPPIGFALLTEFISLLAAWEWSKMMGLNKITHRLIYLMLVACIFLSVFFIPIHSIFYLGFLWWLFALLLVLYYPKNAFWWKNSKILLGIMGFLVIVPCWVAINYIRYQSNGIATLLFLFILIWGADSAAYFVGKKWGKTKLIPKVSPGKTLQGFFGALGFSIIFAFIAASMSEISYAGWPWIILLSLITVMFSVVGDLLESMIKRQAGLKDSGQILPGHGGILDRIDSLTAALPIFVFLSWMFASNLN